jgi:hypothetical protein
MAQNIHRLLWIRLDFTPQIPNQFPQQANATATANPPDCVRQVGIRQHAAVRIRQKLWQLELLLR